MDFKEKETGCDPLDGDARRILIDMTQAHEAYRDTMRQLRSHRGTMKWIVRGEGRQYLFRQRNSRGDGKSLEPRSEQTEQVFRRFHARKAELRERRDSLLAEIKRQSAFCRAVGVNRVPAISARIARAIEGAHLQVVGTHALYAYETLAGVRFRSNLLTTLGLDLLWDAGRQLTLAQDPARPGEGLMALLKKADKTFERLDGSPCRAVNAKGFMVDLITPAPEAPLVPRDLQSSGPSGDLEAAEFENLQWLLTAALIRRTVVGADGYPAVFEVPDPRVFAAHKLWLAEQPGRGPLKRERDLQQARAVVGLLLEYLPRYSLEDSAIQGLPAALRKRLRSAAGRALHAADRPPGEPGTPGEQAPEF